MITKKKVAFQTFGCKLNYSETSSIANKLNHAIIDIVDYKEFADIYVIHSCSVTMQAEKKVNASIRAAKRLNSAAKIVVIGCYAQLRPEILKNTHGVDLVLGNIDKYILPDIINFDDSFETMHYGDKTIMNNLLFSSSYSLNNRTRSFFKIQDGCDHFCSYCTIPFARGRSRSDTTIETIAKAEEILGKGIKEIVLTGVNIGEFGKNNNESLYELLKLLIKIDKLERIRISSIEPELLTDDIIDLVANNSKIMPHFHIPIQSGCDKILKLMRRKYLRDTFANRVLNINKLIPNACIVADIIVGFPNENDDDFKDTYNFIDSLPISMLHVFSFSRRAGTLADKFEDQITNEVKQMRRKQLQILSDSKKDIFYNNNIGKNAFVLWEQMSENNLMYGFTDNYIRCSKIYDINEVNNIEKVKLVSFKNNIFEVEKIV